MLSWDDFRYVKAIADTRSLGGAAQELSVNHSTVFRRLAQIGPLLKSLGKNRLLVGGQMDKEVVAQAPFDVRYIYLAGGLCDGSAPCPSCVSCTSAGQSCANSNPTGCKWWGC